MRIVKAIFFGCLALILIACAGIFIFFQIFDSDQYLSPIAKKASIVIGRSFSVGHVGLGISERGISVDAWPVTIADDLGFTAQPFIKIDRVRISLDLKSLVLQREIRITGVLLQSPQVHIIRSLEGNFNFQSIKIKKPDGVGIVSALPNAMAGHKGQRPVLFEPRNHSFNGVSKIEIQDASISFIDQSQTMPLDIWLKGINARVNGLSLSKQSVQVSDLKLNIDLSQLDNKEISPEIPPIPVLKNIAGIVQVNMAHLEIGNSGDLAANGEVAITGGVIKNFNIIKTVLSHTLGAYGGMQDNIDNLFNGPLKEKLGAQDTEIEKGMAKFSIHDKTIFIDDSLVQTDIFEYKAQGSVDQGLNMDLQTMLHLNSDVSAALVNELDGLKYLCDDSKRIAIGASLKGVIPHLKYKPDKDFRKKSKKMLIEEGANILGALLGGGQTSQQDQGSDTQDSGENPKKKFKNMLKILLQ